MHAVDGKLNARYNINNALISLRNDIFLLSNNNTEWCAVRRDICTMSKSVILDIIQKRLCLYKTTHHKPVQALNTTAATLLLLYYFRNSRFPWTRPPPLPLSAAVSYYIKEGEGYLG